MAADRSTRPERVRIRGTRDGLSLSLPELLGSDDLLAQVAEALDSSREFLGTAPLVIDYGPREPEQQELLALLALLQQRDIHSDGIAVARPEQRAILREWGIDAVRVEQPQRPVARAAETISDERDALYIKRTLRSGAAVHSDRDVIILGDVNAGAEVTSVGDVIVWGVLRGTVHAGSTGDESARICALRLQPTQIRIGSHVARPPDGKGQAAEGPQSAYISDATIVVEPWRGTERRGRAG
jgi:septum site-determining protein MinC